MANPDKNEFNARLREIAGRITESDLLNNCCAVARECGNKISESDKGAVYDYNHGRLWVLYFAGKNFEKERLTVSYDFKPVFWADMPKGNIQLPKVRHNNKVLSIFCYHPGDWENKVSEFARGSECEGKSEPVDREITDIELADFERRFGKFKIIPV